MYPSCSADGLLDWSLRQPKVGVVLQIASALAWQLGREIQVCWYVLLCLHGQIRKARYFQVQQGWEIVPLPRSRTYCQALHLAPGPSLESLSIVVQKAKR